MNGPDPIAVLLALHAVIRQQPTPPPFVPANDATPQWQAFLRTPYVTDTLGRLVGPDHVTVQAHAFSPPGAPDAYGYTTQHGDTLAMFG
ncbi:MAG TPA: hypothetical protein VEU55_01605, partial [Gemmatimonadales bacterium]|nr:hypothetical protein [Gemmatimonadales bacterium]